jgi:hypothetical protein
MSSPAATDSAVCPVTWPAAASTPYAQPTLTSTGGPSNTTRLKDQVLALLCTHKAGDWP